MTLDELLAATRTDRTRMPELVAMSRRLLADPDPETRAHAASMAFYAVRQVFPSLTITERTSLCEATLVELDAAIARGLAGPEKPLASALRSVLLYAIEKPLELDQELRRNHAAHHPPCAGKQLLAAVCAAARAAVDLIAIEAMSPT